MRRVRHRLGVIHAESHTHTYISSIQSFPIGVGETPAATELPLTPHPNDRLAAMRAHHGEPPSCKVRGKRSLQAPCRHAVLTPLYLLFAAGLGDPDKRTSRIRSP